MTPTDARIALLVIHDPARRRRLTRRAGIEAARLGLRVRFSYEVDGTAVLARCDGQELARLDPFDEPDAAHD